MTVLNISFPEELDKFVAAEALSHGYASSAEYIRAVMEALRHEKSRAALEKTLLDRTDGPPAIDLTPQVWADLQKRVERRLEKRAG